jgi:hypothetical protein
LDDVRASIRVRRVPVISVVIVVFIAGLAACDRAATPQEFQKLAVTTLTDEATSRGITLLDAACQRPGSTQVGTVFSCSAAGQTGEILKYDVLIDTATHVVITPRQ